MEKYIIDDRIFNVKFSCDVGKCRGACCTLKGAGGAPILDEEVKIIKKNIDIVKKYLHPVHVYSLETAGFLEGRPGNYSVNSVNDEECVFSFYEEGIAKCSFQKAFYNEESDFKKPISCHLFPVRISGIKRNILKYEEINECLDALEKGEEENISVFEFAKDSLIREYGIGFYNDLRDKYLNKS